MKLARELAMRVIERHQRPAGRAFFDGSRSTWIQYRTTRRTAPSSSPSSTGTTIAGATCQLLAFLTFDKEREQYLCVGGAAARTTACPPPAGPWACLCRQCNAPACGIAFPRARFLVRQSNGGFAKTYGGLRGFLDAEYAARLRGGDGQERRVAAPRRARPDRGAGPQSAASGQYRAPCIPTLSTRPVRGATRAHAS